MKIEETSPDAEKRGRAITLHDGTKAYIKLDGATWRAIEMLAMYKGCEWDDWVRSVWAGATSHVPREKWDEINRAGLLRTVVIEKLMQWIDTSTEMIKQYQDQLGGLSPRVSVALCDGVSLVMDSKNEAQNLAERIGRALQERAGQ